MAAINGHRDMLIHLRTRLLGDMTQMTDTALADASTVRMPSDMADVGTESFDQELTLGLLGNNTEVLEQVQAALQRIEDGSFGRCEACERAIPKARLDAIPYAALCIKCAEEKENGH